MQLDQFFSHWSIKFPLKFFAPIMRYWTFDKFSKKSVVLLYALATREAEFRIPRKLALFPLFFGKFLPKFTSKIRKKDLFFLNFSGNCAEYLANILRQSEDLPKLCQILFSTIQKFAEREKKAKRNPKHCRISILFLDFGDKFLQKICL